MTTEQLDDLAAAYIKGSDFTVLEGIYVEAAYVAGARKMLQLVLDKVEELEEEVHTSCTIKWVLDTNKLNAIFGKLNGSKV